MRPCYDRDLEKLETGIRSYAKACAEEEGLQTGFETCDVFPETVNDSACAELVRQEAKGCGRDYPQVHTAEYDFNDEILETAVDVFCGLARI